MAPRPPAERPGDRRGRPAGTSARALEVIALNLFTEKGFQETTVEQIAAEAGVSRRSFFRYFESKTAILWRDFDQEVAALRSELARVPASVPLMEAIRLVAVMVNRYRTEDIPELRLRMNLISGVPALQASAALHYDSWEKAVSEFASTRLAQPPDSLYPMAIGRSTLAACRAAYDQWIANADSDLTAYLDAALSALAGGFDPQILRAKPSRTPTGESDS